MNYSSKFYSPNSERTDSEKLNEAIVDKLAAMKARGERRPTGNAVHDEHVVGMFERHDECAESRIITILEDFGVTDIAGLRDALGGCHLPEKVS